MQAFFWSLAHNSGLWACYLAGQCVAILIRADQGAMSRFTPWRTIWDYIVAHQNLILYRFLFATALFWLWWHTPQVLGSFVWEKAQQLPLNYATAAIYGGMSDRVLDYVMTKFGCTEKTTHA